ncbi:MAG: hypothetical protein ACLFO5_08370, partial [Opitutales bacterium]
MRYGVAGLVLLGSVSVASAINIDGFTTDENDRFANDSSFVADQFDLSGVGINNNGHWLTMLSDEVFISAEHLKPATGSSVTFYESNDPDGASSTRSVTSNTQQIGTSDLYVGTLDSPLSS